MEGSGRSISFRLPAARSLAGLLRALKGVGYVAGPVGRTAYRTLFFETQDGRLFRAGLRLGLGLRKGRPVWRQEGTGAPLETPAPTALTAALEGRAWLEASAAGCPEAAASAAGPRRLLPLVRLAGRRSEADLASPSGAGLDVSLDVFWAASPGEAPRREGPPLRLLTVRLSEGEPAALQHAAAFLRDLLRLEPYEGDACSAGLLAVDLSQPGAPLPARLAVLPTDRMAEAARKVVERQALLMERNSAGTRLDLDPEYLHDLRVATRRLRAALRLFGAVLGVRRAEALRCELRWIGGLLGGVRDLDVQLRDLEPFGERLGEAERVLAVLRTELLVRRGPALEALRSALASRRYASLLRRLLALGSSPVPKRLPAGGALPVLAAAPPLIQRAARRVFRVGRAVTPQSPPPELHRLRILFKRLRYTCEFFREAFPEVLPELIESMVRFQDCLGEHQDAVVAMARIQDLARQLVARGRMAPEELLDLGGLIQVHREVARDRRARLAGLWKGFDRPSVRRALAGLGAPAPEGRETTGRPMA
ncbi:MAG: CHAD domain-containing protein [Acidobacteriota bacterium]